MATSLAAVVVYVLATQSHDLVGEEFESDEVEYDLQGAFFTEGKLWWSTSPFGEAHPSAWKAPAYPAWVGLVYAVLGRSPLRVEIVQAAVLAPLTVALTWLLARRLFGPRVAIVSAAGIAIFPLVFEYYGLLFPEALAIPLTMAVLLAVLDREPTPRRAAAVGVLLGASLLVRPSSFILLAAIAAAWIFAAGGRRGAAMTALAAAVAVLVVVPWTARNALTEGVGLVPISVQDGAAYGTFNSEAANDEEYPYAWRAIPRGYESDLGLDDPPASDAEFRSRLQDAAWEYIRAHPSSLFEAFYWNGLRRFWDLRSPDDALAEVDPQGRSRAVRTAGLALYYVVLPLALVGLWRLRRRVEIAAPVLALFVAASLVFTVIAGTRYRAPLEPLLVILAASLLGPVASGRPTARRSAGESLRSPAPAGGR